MKNATPENVLQRLKQLHSAHASRGDENRFFGVDTLCMLFPVTFNEMVGILENLVIQQKITMIARTEGSKRTGKNNVIFVKLLEK